MQTPGQHSSTEQVKKQLDTAYRSILSKRNGVVLLRAVLILLTGFTAFIIAEQVFYFSVATKSVLLILFLLATGISYLRGLKSIHPEQFKQFYREFSRKSNLPELKDTLDLEKSGSGNRELIDAAILQNLGKIESARLSKTLSEYVKSSVDYTHHKRLLTLSIATLIIFGFTSFNFGNATQRAFSFWENYEKPNPYTFTLKPGDVTLEQGSPFQVDIEFHGNLVPEEVSLKIKTRMEEDFRTRVMEFSGNTYSSVSQDLNNELQYYVEMDGFKSDLHTADVQLRPRFSQLQATVIPPAYTEIDSTITSYPMSQLRAYEGSVVKLAGELNKQASRLQIYTGEELQDLSVRQDSTFSFELEVDKPDTLRFYIEDENGLTNRNPFQIIVVPQSDEYPIVEVIEPGQNLKEVNPEEINLLYRATDDFRLTAASLNYELSRAYVDEPVTGTISLDKPSQGSLEAFSWNLSEFNLKPQDILTFWISVQDNDGYNGFKSSSSQKIILEVPSLVDYFDDLDEEENEVATDLDEVSESFEQTRELYERFKEKMKDNPQNAGYEEKRELEQVQKQQEEVQKKIDELNKKFEELKNEMSQNNILSEETQKAYQELQKLMEEIDDPAYREALKKLQEQLGQMNPEQLRQAMQELEFNEELYKERLQRTIELFKKLKLNSDLDKLAKSFEDMARKEEELSQSHELQQANQHKDQLRNSLQENEKLKKQVDSLSENLTPKSRQAIGEYQEDTKNELDGLSEDMKEEIEGREENSGENRHPNRQEKYQQLAENTKSMMQSMNRNQMNVNIAGLRYVLHSLLNLSLEQEDLTTLASATENRSQAYVGFARNQRNVEEIFKSVSDSLFELSSEIPQFSNQINKKKLEVSDRLQRSLEQMTERNRSQSSVASRQALGGINDISFMVANLLEQLQNSQNGGQGGSGMSMQQMMEQLGETGEQQQQLNQRLQEMINDMQGERLSQDQMERLNQMARQQNQIRKQLQELQRSGDLDGDKIGSELERMIEDMEDTINDLRGGAADPILIERQQNILSRMLEAEQAMQERDEEDKREGSVADDFERSTPPELTLEELEKQIRRRLNDPNFTQYSPDYQRLIENYFELLKQLQEREIQ
ncbi:MAG: hypothetical protein HUJ22_00430 [Gracilimonas sp.]|uniref:DUF4175 family protein n=1 Tax=Gracilimonas sp. TaxID=1974203 RepID=UPI0019A09EF7|nr:hypothetical protein [Gracilimonas sp.]MBD3615005.1 hypothetical protein [Gracilimonas sp.]